MAKTKQTSGQGADVSSREDEKFRILADVTSLAVFIYQEGKLKYVNAAAEQLTGYPHDELMMMNYIKLFPPSMWERARTWNAALVRGQRGKTTSEVSILTREGETRWVVLTAAIVDYDGKPAWMGTAFDITGRKRSEVLQDAVYRIAQAADRSHSLDELFPAVHAIVGEVMTATNFYIALKDNEHNLIYFPYYVDEYDNPEKVTPPGRGLTEYVMHTGRSLLCDFSTQERLEAEGEVDLVGTPSPIWLGVPLSIDDEVIGAMVVQDYHNPAVYGEGEQRVLEFVSSQVAMAINRKRTEDALRENEARVRRRADELAALYETAQDISLQHNLMPLLQTLVDRAAALLGTRGGAVFLFDQEREQLELVVSRGLDAHIGLQIRPGEGISGQAAVSLMPVIDNDYTDSPQRLRQLDDVPIIAALAVPMLHRGELVGVLTLCEFADPDGKSGRAFSQDDTELLSLFSGSAASAVHNARLYGETRQRLVELELLYQVSLASAQIHSLRAVAQRILDALEQMLRWNASIWIIEHQHPVLLAHSASGMSGEAHRQRLSRLSALVTSFDDGIIGWVCSHGRVVRSGNVKNNPYYVTIDENVQSELCVPLKVGGRTIGCINVESEIPDGFSEHDERLLTTLANQAAVSIENARLFEDARQRAARQAALNSIITASARAGAGLDEILNIAIDQTLKALGLEMGAVWLSWSPRTIQKIAVRGLSTSLETAMLDAVLSGSDPVVRTSAVDDWRVARHPYAELFPEMGILSTIAVPLLSKEKRLGGLTVACPDVRKWSQEEIVFVDAVGREVGLAAERSRLFEQTSRRLSELEAINKVSTALRVAHSLPDILAPLVDETLKALQADAGSIWLYNPKKKKLRQEIGRGWFENVTEIELDRGEGIPGRVLETGDIHFSSDVARDMRTAPPMQGLVPAGLSAVCVPIRAETEAMGMLFITVSMPREFSGDDARLLITLTEIAGSAIHRMRLTEQLVRHAAELEERVAERTSELESALRKAQAADRLKSEFIANVNHELRTPLTNLVLYYQMLRAQPTVKTEERLGVIGRELQRLRNLIEDLLNLSRFDLGQVPFRPSCRDLNALIQPLISDRTPLAEERGLSLQTDLQPDLKPVFCDEPMLVQAVSNLLTNALNYTPVGGTVLVRTMNETVDGQAGVSFCVKDTGPGIDAEDLPHLFERFYRGKTGHKSGAPGTGLGLAIVKSVVEHHRGRIEVRNRTDGPGSVFTIWLPVEQKQES